MNIQAKNPTLIRAGLILIFGALVALAGCRSTGGSNLPFIETFDEPGNWGVGEDAYSIGKIIDGVYDFKNLDAAKIIKEIAGPLINGGGGGQKTLATAGGQEPGKLKEVIEKVKSLFA